MASKYASKQLKSRVILSFSHEDAKIRVKSLYKAWYRQIPHLIVSFDIPLTHKKCKEKLRQEFMKHKEVCDLRVKDMMIIKGQMLLKEVINKWMTKKNLGWIFEAKPDPVRKNFVAKFLDGENF